MMTDKEKEMVLVAEDDDDTRILYSRYFQQAGFKVITAANGKEAMDRIRKEIDVFVVDLRMPRASGLECLRYSLQNYPAIPVIVMSAYGEIQDAVEAMKQGAFYYLNKPLRRDDLVKHTRLAIRSARLIHGNRELSHTNMSSVPTTAFVSQSEVIKELLQQVEIFSTLDSNILITGESGTGKTTLARMIHQSSPRAKYPFISVNCAGLPRDLFETEMFGHEKGAFTGAIATRLGRAELADGGTLYLDEIGDFPIELQPKLLTFLEDRTVQRIGASKSHQVDVRFISATHNDLYQMCREKAFREDLFYRLNVLTLTIPPLRDRPEDILLLVEQALSTIAKKRKCAPLTLTESARAVLLHYRWPGNVRELENVLERASAITTTSTIELGTLKFPSSSLLRPVADEDTRESQTSVHTSTLMEIQRRAILRALEESHGSKAEAARRLGISKKSVYNKLKQSL